MKKRSIFQIKVVPQEIVNNDINPPNDWLLNIKMEDFPIDYIDFIQEFGEGILANTIRIFTPTFIDQLIIPWRLKSKNNPIFKSHSLINTNQLDQTIILGDDCDNAQILYFNGFYYIYIIEFKECIIKAGSSLEDVFNWYRKGSFFDPIELNSFTPFDSNKATSRYSKYIGSFFYDHF